MSEPVWLVTARNDIGNPESLGPNDSPLIRRMLGKLNGLWLRGQPWCGSFMAYVMQQCGIEYPKDYYRAKAWATWGSDCGPIVGAVVVFERTGGGHIGILAGVDTLGNLLVIGGNQGDAVSVRAFDPGRVLAYRWPPGKTFEIAALPVASTFGPISKNEV